MVSLSAVRSGSGPTYKRSVHSTSPEGHVRLTLVEHLESAHMDKGTTARHAAGRTISTRIMLASAFVSVLAGCAPGNATAKTTASTSGHPKSPPGTTAPNPAAPTSPTPHIPVGAAGFGAV